MEEVVLLELLRSIRKSRHDRNPDINDALLRMIAVDMQPSSVVNDRRFVLDPRYQRAKKGPKNSSTYFELFDLRSLRRRVVSSSVLRVYARANDLEGEFDACIANRRDWLTVSALERRVLRACLARVLSRDLHKGRLKLHASTLAGLTAMRGVASPRRPVE